MDHLKVRFHRWIVRARNLSPLSGVTYVNGVERIERVTGKPAAEITARDLHSFLLSDYHPTTKNMSLVAFRSFHWWGAVVEELWPLDPKIMAVKGPKVIRPPKPALSPEEAVTLLRACKRSNEFRAVWLPLFQGMRVSEAARIGEREWRPDRFVFMAKGRKTIEVPVHPELAKKRDVILSNETTKDTLKAVCRAMSLLLGIRFSPHTLRHTFARVTREMGVERATVGGLLGHGPQDVTEIYIPVTFDEMYRALPVLDYERAARRRHLRSA